MDINLQKAGRKRNRGNRRAGSDSTGGGCDNRMPIVGGQSNFHVFAIGAAAQTRLAYLFEPTNGVPWDARVFRTRVAKSSLRAASTGIFFSQGRCGEPCFPDSSCDRTEQFSTTLGPLLPPYAGCVRASRDPRSANGGTVGSLTWRMVVSCGLLPVSNLSQSTKSYGGTTVSRKKSDATQRGTHGGRLLSAGGNYFYSFAQLDNLAAQSRV